jgi:hypothetical protein
MNQRSDDAALHLLPVSASHHRPTSLRAIVPNVTASPHPSLSLRALKERGNLLDWEGLRRPWGLCGRAITMIGKRLPADKLPGVQ